MRPARSLLIYFVTVFVGGALLAPWLYWMVQEVAPHSSLAAHPFHRYLDRTLLGLALIGLWPLARKCGLNSWRHLGFERFDPKDANLARASVIGIFSSLSLYAVCILGGARIAVVGAKHVPSVLTAAVTVSILEEALFRGGLFGILRKTMDWRLAALISSVVYAFVHFLQKADLPGPVTWTSGLRLLPLMFSHAALTPTFVPGLVNLTAVGLAFAVAYQRTGTLYASIVLHGVWIFLSKTFLYLSQPAAGASVALWGGENFLNGWFALPFLLAAAVLAWRGLAAETKPND